MTLHVIQLNRVQVLVVVLVIVVKHTSHHQPVLCTQCNCVLNLSTIIHTIKKVNSCSICKSKFIRPLDIDMSQGLTPLFVVSPSPRQNMRRLPGVSVICDTTSKYRDISPTPPLIFTGGQKVRFWPYRSTSFNFEPLSFRNLGLVKYLPHFEVGVHRCHGCVDVVVCFSELICQFSFISYKVCMTKDSDKTDMFLLNYSNLFWVHILCGHKAHSSITRQTYILQGKST